MQDALVLTWTEAKDSLTGPQAETFYSFGTTRIPYLEMTSVKEGLRLVYDFMSEGAKKDVLKIMDYTFFALGKEHVGKHAVETLRVSTTNSCYELLVLPSKSWHEYVFTLEDKTAKTAETWVKKLHDLMCSAHREAARFCRNCGTPVQIDWTFCKQCGMKP
jgi:hypothetical protein